jgi:hypothetical protein
MDRIPVLSESNYCFVHASNVKLPHYTDGVAPLQIHYEDFVELLAAD